MNWNDDEKVKIEKTNGGGSGIGFCGLLFIVFLVLKLTHVIDWSWWWITAPLWGGLALFILIVIITFIVFAIRDRQEL